MELLVTDNDSNKQRLWGVPNETGTPHAKDAFHTHVCGDNAAGPEATRARVKPAGGRGTKAAAWTVQRVAAGQSCEVWFRFLCDTGSRGPESAASAVPRSGVTAASEPGASLAEMSQPYSHGAPRTLATRTLASSTAAVVSELLRMPLGFDGFLAGAVKNTVQIDSPVLIPHTSCLCSYCRARRRGGPLLRRRAATKPVARGPGHSAPGLGGPIVVQAILPLWRRNVARRCDHALRSLAVCVCASTLSFSLRQATPRSRRLLLDAPRAAILHGRTYTPMT